MSVRGDEVLDSVAALDYVPRLQAGRIIFSEA